MDNPNPYDDPAYLEATNRLQNALPKLLDDLWLAGATVDNIEDELEEAIQNCDEFGAQHEGGLIISVEAT
jgi:hypothetical protein